MSSDPKVVSLSGAPVFRYTDGEKEWEAPHGEECLAEISDHIERHIGPVHMVFHEVLSDTVHIDVHHVTPTDTRPWHTLITSGMSDLPLHTPEGVDTPRFLELMITLPAHWQVDAEAFQDEQWYWPIRQLKFLARFPHKYDTWLGGGHTIPHGDPPEPFADNTALSGILLLPPLNVPDEFHRLAINAGKTISFLCLTPLYEEEMNLKLRDGTRALLEKFDKHGIGEVVAVDRKNVARKRFGLF